jgi:hypothetical protein
LEIAALEEERAALSQAVNRAGGDYEQLRVLSDRLQALEEELETRLAGWLALSEIGG